jgi:hypothetical protein
MSDYERAVDTMLGRWKSQILYAGVKLGIFESLDRPSTHPRLPKS